MFVRVTIEVYIVSPDIKDAGNNPSPRPVSPSRSDTLKAVFNAYLEEVGGFENWQESAIAMQMLADPASVFESLDGESRYLLEGYHDSDFYHVFIDWQHGKQPCVLKVERASLRWRVK